MEVAQRDVDVSKVVKNTMGQGLNHHHCNLQPVIIFDDVNGKENMSNTPSGPPEEYPSCDQVIKFEDESELAQDTALSKESSCDQLIKFEDESELAQDTALSKESSCDQLIKFEYEPEHAQNAALSIVEQLIDFIQLYGGPTSPYPSSVDDPQDDESIRTRKETVKSIIALLSLNLPVCCDYEEVEETSCTDDSSNSSSYSSCSDDDDDDNGEFTESESKEQAHSRNESPASNAIDKDKESQDKFSIVADNSSIYSSTKDTDLADGDNDQCIQGTTKITTDVSSASILDSDGGSVIEKSGDNDKRPLNVAKIAISSNREQKLVQQQRSIDEGLWNWFVASHNTGLSGQIGDDDDDEEFRCQNADESSSSESDSESDEDSDGDLVTFPFMDSDSDSSDGPISRSNAKSENQAGPNLNEPEVITLDDDDDIEVIGDEMICARCPPGKNIFKDKDVFIIHRSRHIGRSHFVCPVCLKPFTKFSFCVSHEIRIHGESFNFENPIVTLANEFIKKREELKRAGVDINGDSVDHIHKNLEIPEGCMSQIGLDDFDDVETDEDSPKFYPDYAVPSTTLYPYRGPEVHSMFDSYEIQLKYGRKKRNYINTAARMTLAHREKLREEGRLPETADRFVPVLEDVQVRPNKRKRDEDASQSDTSCQAGSSGKRNKRAVPLADYSDQEDPSATTSRPNPPRRKRRKASELNKTSKLENRTFLSSVMSRCCLLCPYIWNTETELRTHRDEKHPNKKLLNLMTIAPKKAARKLCDSENSKSSHNDIGVNLRKRKRNETTSLFGPSSEEQDFKDMSKEAFLSQLGLISIRKLALRKRKNPIRLNYCYVKLNDITKDLSRNGKVFVCNRCDKFDKTKGRINLHKFNVHGIAPKTRNVKQNKTNKAQPKEAQPRIKQTAIKKGLPNSNAILNRKKKPENQNPQHFQQPIDLISISSTSSLEDV